MRWVCVVGCRYEAGEGRVGLGGERWSLDYLLRPSRTGATEATPLTALNVRCLVCLFGALLILLSGLLTLLADQANAKIKAGISLTGVEVGIALVTLLCVCCLLVISRQPQSRAELAFRVPLVPWFPGLSMFFNIYLMLNLDWLTWLRFAVWMAIGCLIYFGYGISHSSEENRLSFANPAQQRKGNASTSFDDEDP